MTTEAIQWVDDGSSLTDLIIISPSICQCLGLLLINPLTAFSLSLVLHATLLSTQVLESGRIEDLSDVIYVYNDHFTFDSSPSSVCLCHLLQAA